MPIVFHSCDIATKVDLFVFLHRKVQSSLDIVL